MPLDLPKYEPLRSKLFHVKQRDELPFSWHKRNYKDMLFTDSPDGAPFGDNDGSSIQLHRLLRKPANVFLFRYENDNEGSDQNAFNDIARIGDLHDLETRLGTTLEKEAFVCWGTPNTIPGPNFWVDTITPRQITDPLYGITAPADLTKFIGGRFIAIVDPFGGYYYWASDPNQFDNDVSALKPYIDLFDSFHVLVIVDSWDIPTLAPEYIGSNDPVQLAEVISFLIDMFTNGWALIRQQCTENKKLGFEVIDPDYKTILKRIREILSV